MVGRKVKDQKRTIDKAFILYRECKGNCAEVQRRMKSQHDVDVSHKTITRWATAFDWEIKVRLVDNEFKRYLRANDDPIIHEVAMGDVETVKHLGKLARIVGKVLMRPEKYGIFPRNISELTRLMQFIREQGDIIKQNQEHKIPVPGAIDGTGKPQQLIYNDNRSINFGEKLAELSPSDRNALLASFREVTDKGLPALADKARTDAFENENA